MKDKLKRFFALAIVIIWGILLVATLISAVVDTEFTRTLFPGLMFTVICLPVVAYAMLLVYKILKGNRPNDNADTPSTPNK